MWAGTVRGAETEWRTRGAGMGRRDGEGGGGMEEWMSEGWGVASAGFVASDEAEEEEEEAEEANRLAREGRRDVGLPRTSASVSTARQG